MSRKNNKSIKKRYNEFLKSQERREQQRTQEREYRREEERQVEEAEELLEDLGIEEEEEKPEKMEIERVPKGKHIKKRKAKINKKKGERKRRIK